MSGLSKKVGFFKHNGPRGNVDNPVGPPVFSLTPNNTTIIANNQVVFTADTNLASQPTLYWTANASSNVFTDQSNTGQITFNINGEATINKEVFSPTSFDVKLRTYQGELLATSPTVTFSNLKYDISISPTNDTYNFNINLDSDLKSQPTLYWNLNFSQTANIPNVSLTSSTVNLDSVGNAVISNIDVLQPTNLNVQFRSFSVSGDIIATSNTVLVQRPPYYTICPGNYSAATATTITATAFGNISLTNITPSISPPATTAGAVLATNNKIYAIPGQCREFVEIDPANSSVTVFGNVLQALGISNVGLGSGWEACRGAVVDKTGNIHCISYDATKIVKLNPNTQTATSYGNILQHVWTTNTIITYNFFDGAALLPNGNIVIVPYRGGNKVLEIEPSSNTIVSYGNFSQPFAPESGIYSETWKWGRPHLSPNGKVYALPGSPSAQANVLCFDPSTKNITLIPLPVYTTYGGSPHIDSIMTETGNIIGIIASQGGASFLSTYLNKNLIFNTLTNQYSFTTSSSDFSSPRNDIMHPCRFSATGNIIYPKTVAGNVQVVSFNKTTFTQTTSNVKIGTESYMSSILHPNGNVYAIRYGFGSNAVLAINNTTSNVSTYNWIISAHHNK